MLISINSLHYSDVTVLSEEVDLCNLSVTQQKIICSGYSQRRNFIFDLISPKISDCILPDPRRNDKLNMRISSFNNLFLFVVSTMET